MKAEDHTGITYNRLTGIRYVCNRHMHRIWLWQCECGRTALVSGTFVKQGLTKSCGCLRVESNKARTPASYKRRDTYRPGKGGNAAWKALGDEDRSTEPEEL